MADPDWTSAVIVVSGLPRSGTSMTMQMLVAAGVPVVADGVRQAGEDNPLGYYEDERVKRLHKEDGAWLTEARGKAIKVISNCCRAPTATPHSCPRSQVDQTRGVADQAPSAAAHLQSPQVPCT